MNLYLIRHARQNSTLYNVNVSLSDVGIEQAHLVGKRLTQYNIEKLYSSDLIRAVETAEIINNYLKVPYDIDKRLREADLGDLTGLNDAELRCKYREFLSERAKMINDIPYPGGENCEMIFRRVFAVFQEITQGSEENVGIIMHGGAMRALLTGLVEANFARWLVFGRQIENCSISELFYDDVSNTYHIERFNDYAHLERNDRLLRKHFSSGFFHCGDKE